MTSFRYILRYLIDPHFHAPARMRELVAFCKASRIEEVMMFVTAEELSAGHPTEAELDAYDAEVNAKIDEALQFAADSPFPDVGEINIDVYGEVA